MQFPYDIPLLNLLNVIFILFGPLLTLQVGEVQNSDHIWPFAFPCYDISARITPYLVSLLRTAGC